MAVAFVIVVLLVWAVVVLWMRSRAGMQEGMGPGGLAGRFAGPGQLPGKLETYKLLIDGQKRHYHILRKPGAQGQPRPVLLALHGGNGGAQIFLHRSGLAGQCFAAGMDVVLPETEGSWADGRNTTTETWDQDRQFIEAVLADVAKDPGLDETRIYAVGISNGAMFAIRLGIELGRYLGGICAVSGAVPEALSERLGPVEDGPAIPILFVNSDDDRLVPIRGGQMPTLGGLAAGGRILSNAAAVRLWCQRNSCEADPVTHQVAIGACKAKVSDYRGGQSGADVTRILLHKAGHNWPSERPSGQITLEQLVVRFFQRQMVLAAASSQTLPSGAPDNNFTQGSLST